MIRMFETHKIRKQTELSDTLWKVRILDGSELERDVFVPSCIEMLPGLGNYRGEAIFSKRFFAEGNIRLEFKGVSHTATVILDGQEIASHYGAYTPFEAVATDLKPGEHLLEVRTDNRFSEASTVHVPNDYMTYGGITRPVALEQLPGCFIQWAHYTPKRTGNSWACQAEICIRNLEKLEKTVTVSCVLNGVRTELGIVTLEPEKATVIQGILPAENVKEWTPESPVLYSVEALLIENGTPMDDLIERIGFREIKITGNKILLNGAPIRIKGFCRHEDFGGFGCAIPTPAMQKDILFIKDMGGNAIRTSHYPNDERFLDLCDEQGILVWEENHARGIKEAQMKNPLFEEQCETCNLEMVTAHYNHPSIYIWGVMNECASDTEIGRECYGKQLAQLRSLDQSRPVTFASCRFTHENGTNISITDICLDLPDVVSYNMYPQWYIDVDVSAFLREMQGRINEGPGAGKPFIVSEIGAGAIYGSHSVEHLKWSEEYQSEALEKQITAVLSNPDCMGVYIWQFCDCRISSEWFYNRPNCHNNKGIVDDYRRPKLCYETVKRLFHAYK
ncbi:MAG: hypothetical protein IKE24_11485 [Clostridia bacterium]|nr:hypothetical protein [Clostridia bacterium]